MIKQTSDQEYKWPGKVVLKRTSDQTNEWPKSNKWSRHNMIKQNKWANKHVIKKTSDQEKKRYSEFIGEQKNEKRSKRKKVTLTHKQEIKTKKRRMVNK